MRGQANKVEGVKGKMEKGDFIRTPRFGTVKIQEVFQDYIEAGKQGFVEPTHYEDLEHDVLGKSLGTNRMVFAAINK